MSKSTKIHKKSKKIHKKYNYIYIYIGFTAMSRLPLSLISVPFFCFFCFFCFFSARNDNFCAWEHISSPTRVYQMTVPPTVSQPSSLKHCIAHQRSFTFYSKTNRTPYTRRSTLDRFEIKVFSHSRSDLYLYLYSHMHAFHFAATLALL